MNTHMSGQIPGQVPTQAGSQVPDSSQQINGTLASQMQSIGPRTMDHELHNIRSIMREKIFKYIQAKASSDTLMHKLPDLSKRLEDRLYKETRSKEDYLRLIMEPSELHFHTILTNIIQGPQQSSHYITSNATHSTMIPTPGIAQNGITSSVENPGISASNGIMTQPMTNIGNLLPSVTEIGNSTTLNAADGLLSNGHKHQAMNYGFGSSGSNLMPSMTSNNSHRQFSRMIPTPGFSNPQTMTMSSEPSSGTGLSNTETTMILTSEQQSKFVGNQNSHLMPGMGGQIGTGRLNMQHKPSSYGFSNGLSNGKSGFFGSNMQLNGAVTSDGLLTTATYGNPVKPVRQHFEQQHHQTSISTSLPQNMLPIVGDSYPTKAAEIAGSETLRNPNLSVLTPTNNINTGNMHGMSRTNSGMLNNHASLHSLQHSPHIRPIMFDRQQKLNFQTSQSPSDHLLQTLRMQQLHQQPQTYAQFAQNQHQLQRQQQSLQNQRLVMNNDSLRQTSATTTFGKNLMPGNAVVAQSEALLAQSTQQVHFSELQSQYQLNIPAEDHSKGAQFLGHLPGSRELNAPASDLSQQFLRPHQPVEEFVNKVGSLSCRSQTDEFLKTQWQSNPLSTAQLPEMPSREQLKEELRQRITGQTDAQRPHMSSDACVTISDASPARQFAAGVVHVPEDSRKESNIINQRRWLLFLYHASRCSAPKGQCKEDYCWSAQELVMHIQRCDIADGCLYSRCSQSKRLVGHFGTCKSISCPVCIFVKNFIHKCKSLAHSLSNAGFVCEKKIDNETTKINNLPSEVPDERQSLPKRMRIQHTSSFDSKDEIFAVCTTPKSQPYGIQVQQHQESEHFDMKMSSKLEVNNLEIDQSTASEQENLPVVLSNVDDSLIMERCDIEPISSNYIDCHVKQEGLMTEKEPDHAAREVKLEQNESSPEQTIAGKSGKPKIKGVSLTELFTPEQIREHIVGLRRWIGQSKAKAERNQAMEHSMSENSCQLCAVEKLTFEPPPIYCSPCGARIKRNAMYYTIGAGETRHYFCIPCYNEARGDSVEVDGSSYPKVKLEKKKNDEETEEWWVQCDKCEAWQHQICALFNGRRNDGEAEYTCPNCLIQEVERGERKPLPQSAVLGAKDLPKTILSDHIEQRLFRRLKHERFERARHLGKSPDEVPGVEGLVVRVVSSVDKKLEVKQRFLEIFQEENYPKEFPYKSKAVLLFQKIGGVEVCLFGMYVQEFGSECSFPNQRRVYLSYLDSVKYFRPEIKTVTGEALRTFVYHEILIGYLEYCKKRGFTSCYIWACPPLKGEDYILYCHPEIQKTPKSDKLREWYLSMLRKAAKENIVVDLTNLYDHFFTTMGECKAKVTAARLPYFDGDYWPGAAEDMINQLRHEEDGRKQQKKGKTKKTLTKRALKAAGQSDLSGNASKDALLMHKLGETIFPMKEDFIMVHLQHCCNHCCILMVSGRRWVCNQCKNFQLCDKCYEAEQRLEERDRHPIHGREKHGFHLVEINDVVSDTKDNDEILESEFFDTRQAFLSLCQGNHYQYDTLRRAKHSSMMVLYHLHNPTAPAFVTTCNVCHHDIDTGQGWRCEVCPDFDVCDICFKKEGAVDHPHKLTNHPSMADRDAQNKEARQKRVLQLRKMLDLLVHASLCRSPGCQYPNCRKVKRLFRHGIQCSIRASGGCVLCKKMWYLLQIHARACKESECTVPRCRDLKEHQRRMQQQSDSRRRAAVMEMMRQRAAEVADNG